MRALIWIVVAWGIVLAAGIDYVHHWEWWLALILFALCQRESARAEVKKK